MRELKGKPAYRRRGEREKGGGREGGGMRE